MLLWVFFEVVYFEFDEVMYYVVKEFVDEFWVDVLLGCLFLVFDEYFVLFFFGMYVCGVGFEGGCGFDVVLLLGDLLY